MSGPLYKVLNADGSCCHRGVGRWPLPENGQPGDWMPAIVGPLEPCLRGYHLLTREQLVRWLGPTIWEVEEHGTPERIVCHNKIVSRGPVRLVRPLAGWTPQTARLLACDYAERALQREHAAGRDTDMRSWHAVAVGRAFANNHATAGELNVAAEGAGATAWVAAVAAGATAWAAAVAAKAAAGATAWAAARVAAKAAAGAAAEATGAARVAEREWQTQRLWEYLEVPEAREELHS